MSHLPLPIRIAAGLAAVALERARKLPQDVTEWPMTAVSSALQLSMRVQQRITELAIKGDEALANLREPDEDPPWAVFDEDLPAPTYLRPERSNGFDDAGAAWADAETPDADAAWAEALDEVYNRDDRGRAPTVADEVGLDDLEPDDLVIEADPVVVDLLEPDADTGTTPAAGGPVDGSTETANSPTRNAGHAGHAGEGEGPAALPGYPGLTLASVRGRLRAFSVAQLEDLLEYERSHGDRPDFVRMLTNRIATVRGQ